MVSFWPWKGDSSSTASFEKTLSTLSTKITSSQSRLDRTRASSRRARALVTLYLSFAYLVFAIVELLVIGYQKLSVYEWSGMAGGPVLIYGIRTFIVFLYNFRIDSLESRLKDQQQERAKTIQKLKEATKYDSTLELIEKYGGGKPKQGGGGEGQENGDDSKDGGGKKAKGRRVRQSDIGPGGMPSRTGFAPPPTANIRRSLPFDASSPPGTPLAGQPPPPPINDLGPVAEFAPDPDSPSFSGPPVAPPSGGTPPSVAAGESHWYDRILDALLGEDETSPRNRIVLLCQSCRLVNGQAPPGTRSLAEVGRWRCMSCGAENGEDAPAKEDEGKRIVREVLAAGSGNSNKHDMVKEEEEEEAEDEDGYEDENGDTVESVEVGGDVSDGPAASVRRRRGKSKK